ncbi:MAG TPA: hypothetical protein VK760_11610 [Candidatus Acidoferrales bacterium]|nr:hypothetical protein [Candidatus Acidoferrales bacterium]
MKRRDLACIVAGAALGAAGCSAPVRSLFVPAGTASETQTLRQAAPQPEGGRLFRLSSYLTVTQSLHARFQPETPGYWTTTQSKDFVKVTEEKPPGNFRVEAMDTGSTMVKFHGKNGELSVIHVTVLHNK